MVCFTWDNCFSPSSKRTRRTASCESLAPRASVRSASRARNSRMMLSCFDKFVDCESSLRRTLVSSARLDYLSTIIFNENIIKKGLIIKFLSFTKRFVERFHSQPDLSLIYIPIYDAQGQNIAHRTVIYNYIT